MGEIYIVIVWVWEEGCEEGVLVRKIVLVICVSNILSSFGKLIRRYVFGEGMYYLELKKKICFSIEFKVYKVIE